MSEADYMMRFDNSKAARILKIAPMGVDRESTLQNAESEIMHYRNMENTTRDMLADFSRRGWWM
jgi:hypothetical protein